MQDALAEPDAQPHVVRHRAPASTVRRADAIVVLERGRVAEIGRHEELLARPGGVYAKLYALQIFERAAGREAAAGCQLMIKSMTGFASLTRDDERGDDRRDRSGRSTTGSSTCSSACRRRSRPSRARLRALVQRRVARGRVEVSVSMQQRRTPAVDVELNEAFLEALAARSSGRASAGYVDGRD